MATYLELFNILTLNVTGAAELRNKIGIATLITADKIRSGNDNAAPFDQTAGAHEKRLLWASNVFESDRGIQKVFGAVVAANESSTQSQILNATDAVIQSSMDGIADVFATALGSPPA